jgi:hypothetical protein
MWAPRCSGAIAAIGATVHFLDGEMERVGLDQVRLFIAETEIQGNRKGVSTVAIEPPELAQFRTLRFAVFEIFQQQLSNVGDNRKMLSPKRCRGELSGD